MGKRKTDPRIRRTRQLLRDTFIALLLEKSYQAVTVQDIIKRADVARSTFYAHYLDKNDLLMGKNGIFAGNLDHDLALMLQEDEESQSIIPTRALFCHVQAQSRVFKALVGGPGMDLAIEALQQVLHNRIQDKLKGHLLDSQDATELLPLTTHYLAGALLNLIRWWLDHDMPYSAERMDEIFQQLAMPGARAILEI